MAAKEFQSFPCFCRLSLFGVCGRLGWCSAILVLVSYTSQKSCFSSRRLCTQLSLKSRHKHTYDNTRSLSLTYNPAHFDLALACCFCVASILFPTGIPFAIGKVHQYLGHSARSNFYFLTFVCLPNTSSSRKPPALYTT